MKDLLVAPSTRGVTDIAHEVYAVGSRGEGKAKKFVDAFFKEVGAEGAEKVCSASSPRMPTLTRLGDRRSSFTRATSRFSPTRESRSSTSELLTLTTTR